MIRSNFHLSPIIFFCLFGLASCKSGDDANKAELSKYPEFPVDLYTTVQSDGATSYLGLDKVLKIFSLADISITSDLKSKDTSSVLDVLLAGHRKKVKVGQDAFATAYIFLPCSYIKGQNAEALIEFSLTSKEGQVFLKYPPSPLKVRNGSLFETNDRENTCTFIAENSMAFKFSKELPLGSYILKAKLHLPGQILLEAEVDQDLIQ